MRARLWVAAAVLVVGAAISGFVGYTWWRLTEQPLPARSAGFTFTVVPGETLDAVAHRLARLEIIAHWWDLVLLARVRGEGAHIQAGEYRLAAGSTVAKLLDIMVKGRVLLRRFTIVPGTTFAEVLRSLETDPYLDHRLAGLDPRSVMRRLGHPGDRPEGRFFPNTYFFARGTSDAAILERAYSAMQQYLEAHWPERAAGLPLGTPYQALILASIVEKETGKPAERAQVAGVFVRRLERGMRLDADPTVIYGLGANYHIKLTRADMARDTPYNTYLHYGLPPTPICMPGAPAIQAVLHPAAGKALYFVAKGDGTHVFSDTLPEQEKMIEKYELNQGSGGGHGGSGTIHHP